MESLRDPRRFGAADATPLYLTSAALLFAAPFTHVTYVRFAGALNYTVDGWGRMLFADQTGGTNVGANDGVVLAACAALIASAGLVPALARWSARPGRQLLACALALLAIGVAGGVALAQLTRIRADGQDARQTNTGNVTVGPEVVIVLLAAVICLAGLVVSARALWPAIVRAGRYLDDDRPSRGSATTASDPRDEVIELDLLGPR